jgi:hypothetical protein
MTKEIKGTVTLDSVNIENATVRLINETEEEYVDEVLTDEKGEYFFTLPEGHENDEYHLAVEYDDEGTKYNAKSNFGVKGG